VPDIEIEAPEFLADLMGDVLGHKLAAKAANQHECPMRVVVGEGTGPRYEGLFIDPRAEYGVHHHGMVWEVYSGGRPRFGHAWDDNEEDVFGEPVAFETWVRAEVQSLVDTRATAALRELWTGVARDSTPSQRAELESGVDGLLELASRYEGELTYWRAGAAVLRALLRVREGGGDSAEALELVQELVPSLHGRFDEERSDWGLFLRRGAFLLPESAFHPDSGPLFERVDGELQRMLAALGAGMPPNRFLGFFREVVACAHVVRDAFSRALIRRAGQAEELHLAASEYRAYPREMLPILEAALKRSDDDVTILAALQGAYANAGETERATAVGRRLEGRLEVEAPLENLDDDVQSWINHYNVLANEFSSNSPRSEGVPEARARKLIALEAKLNHYWIETFPHRLDECVEQGRFLSSGSGGYVGWMRNLGRYQDAVDHVCAQLADQQLSALRHRAHAAAFETFLNNGLGSFLDSGAPDHLVLALELVNRIERIDSIGQTGDLLYQLACVLARCGETQRAIGYVERAVRAGESIATMANDADLRSLYDHPRFVDLRESKSR
jgi:hypothetical protein